MKILTSFLSSVEHKRRTSVVYLGLILYRQNS